VQPRSNIHGATPWGVLLSYHSTFHRLDETHIGVRRSLSLSSMDAVERPWVRNAGFGQGKRRVVRC